MYCYGIVKWLCSGSFSNLYGFGWYFVRISIVLCNVTDVPFGVTAQATIAVGVCAKQVLNG